MTDVTDMTVAELGVAIGQRSVSPVEVVDAFLSRSKTLNPSLNAFVTFDEEGARLAAKAAEDELMRGHARGPLHGIPIAHKDLYETKGIRSTGGSRVLSDYVPERDATVVRRLAEAGAILIGKTNTHEFAYGPTNEVSMFGPVANPWDLQRISGGSSGGSGAAVAARLVPFATGSDTGGSIRIPAALCGVVGLKPTYGRLSRAGILPLCWTMDHAGPITQTAEDAALFLQATAGHDPADRASSRHLVHGDYVAALDGDVRGLRIGVPRRYFFDRAQGDVVNLVDQAIETLVSLGAVLVDIDIPHIEVAASAALAIYLAEATAYHDDTLSERSELYSPSVRQSLLLGDQILAKDYIHAQRYRTLLAEGLVDIFASIDVLATPATALGATPIGAVTVAVNGVPEDIAGALLRNTEPFNLTGHPAVATPCGFDRMGLPASLQIVGPPFCEGLILKVADAYQRATNWRQQRPEFARPAVTQSPV